MANLVRISAGRIVTRCLQPSLINRATPTLSCLVPSKSLTVTPVRNKRYYGPQEEFEKEREDHHWLKERYVAIALLPLIPGAFVYPNAVMDTLLVSAMVLHSYWRLSGVAEDYIHGEILPKIAQPTVKIATILAFGSLCYFNYFDVGFANAVVTLYTQL